MVPWASFDPLALLQEKVPRAGRRWQCSCAERKPHVPLCCIRLGKEVGETDSVVGCGDMEVEKDLGQWRILGSQLHTDGFPQERARGSPAPGGLLSAYSPGFRLFSVFYFCFQVLFFFFLVSCLNVWIISALVHVREWKKKIKVKFYHKKRWLFFFYF